MNENIKTNLKRLKNLLVLWAVVLAFIVVTGKQNILLVAILLASAVLVYYPVKELFNFNKNLDKGDKHDN